jgi:6-phosphofructokinase 1
VVEVMGRDNGFIALEVGLCCGAEAVLVPEIPYQANKIAEELKRGHARGKLSSILIMAEGAGNGSALVSQLARVTKLKTRLSVLGYIQRGGNPTAHSRKLAAILGNQAILNLRQGQLAHLAGIQNNQTVAVPLSQVFKKTKRIDRQQYRLIYQMAQ